MYCKKNEFALYPQVSFVGFAGREVFDEEQEDWSESVSNPSGSKKRKKPRLVELFIIHVRGSIRSQRNVFLDVYSRKL